MIINDFIIIYRFKKRSLLKNWVPFLEFFFYYYFLIIIYVFLNFKRPVYLPGVWKRVNTFFFFFFLGSLIAFKTGLINN